MTISNFSPKKVISLVFYKLKGQTLILKDGSLTRSVIYIEVVSSSMLLNIQCMENNKKYTVNVYTRM